MTVGMEACLCVEFWRDSYSTSVMFLNLKISELASRPRILVISAFIKRIVSRADASSSLARVVFK